MGFTTGFIGGLALTSSILYLSILAHQRNRLEQSLVLRQSALVLRNVYEPGPTYTPPSARERRAGINEIAKDRWNGEVEKVVRRAQETDWNAVREGVEEKLADVWERIRKSGES